MYFFGVELFDVGVDCKEDCCCCGVWRKVECEVDVVVEVVLVECYVVVVGELEVVLW